MFAEGFQNAKWFIFTEKNNKPSKTECLIHLKHLSINFFFFFHALAPVLPRWRDWVLEGFFKTLLWYGVGCLIGLALNSVEGGWGEQQLRWNKVMLGLEGKLWSLQARGSRPWLINRVTWWGTGKNAASQACWIVSFSFPFFFLHFQKFWNLVDLRCCVTFRCTVKWFSYIYVCIFFFYILFHYRLLQDTGYNSLCYTVGPCWLSIFYIVVCICQSQTPNLSLSPPPLVTINLLSMSESISVL